MKQLLRFRDLVLQIRLGWTEPMSDMHEDVTFVERRQDARIIVNLAGRFSLPDRDGRDGTRLIQCRAVNLSPQAIALSSSFAVGAWEWVVAHIDKLGKIEGTVQRLLQGGFIMSISAGEREKNDLLAR
jgi:hypothetical protein